MAALVIADHDNTHLSDATAKVVTAAAKLGDAVDILIAGANCADVVAMAATLTGVRTILHADAPELEHQLAETYEALILSIAENYDAILTAAGTSGKNYMPRIAARLDVMQVSDIIDIETENVFVRPIYAGNAVATVQSLDRIKVITVRPTSFAPMPQGATVPVETMTIPDLPSISEFVTNELTKSDRPELQAAKIVVSGGRGVESGENFEKFIYPVADKLSAAIGASRAAVDAGYMPNDYQVGQTGKVVAPALYIAVGISGAIQHLAGMKDSKIIVAINKDAEAPIFQVADFGLVGDLFEIMPKLHDAL